jgi:plasmid stabilization system protein ParE
MIYRVLEDAVEILAVVHGARDLERLWKRKRR